MKFIKTYPQYYIPILIAPFLAYRYKYHSFLNERNKKYHEFDFKDMYMNCRWCGQKIGSKGVCDECFIRMFNTTR